MHGAGYLHHPTRMPFEPYSFTTRTYTLVANSIRSFISWLIVREISIRTGNERARSRDFSSHQRQSSAPSRNYIAVRRKSLLLPPRGDCYL